MSTIYQGNAGNTSNAQAATINGATNASPIVISTVAAHGFQTGDLVNVAGVAGNTAANNSTNSPWTIVVIDTTHFSLTGSTGSGAYTSGGTATDVSLTPATTLPSDGDARSAASVNVPLETALDRTQFLILRIGAYRVLNRYVKEVTDDSFAAWSTNSSASLTSASWLALANASAIFFPAGSVAPVCSTGDVFDISFTTTGTCTAATEAVAVAVGIGIELAGGAYGIIAGSGQKLSHGAINTPLCLRTTYTVTSGTNQTFNFAIMGLGNIASPPSLNLLGHYTMVVNHLRAN